MTMRFSNITSKKSIHTIFVRVNMCNGLLYEDKCYASISQCIPINYERSQCIISNAMHLNS